MLGELLLIVIIALLVIKPEQWPTVARTLGRWIRYGQNLMHAWRSELPALDLKPPNQQNKGHHLSNDSNHPT